jgi:predicted  nucleic acid-binding Zn-ribbon protein
VKKLRNEQEFLDELGCRIEGAIGVVMIKMLRMIRDLQAEVATLKSTVADYESLHELQSMRMKEAVALWRAEDPTREGVHPDLGNLLAWLMSRADAFEDALDNVAEKCAAAEAERDELRKKYDSLAEDFRVDHEHHHVAIEKLDVALSKIADLSKQLAAAQAVVVGGG